MQHVEVWSGSCVLAAGHRVGACAGCFSGISLSLPWQGWACYMLFASPSGTQADARTGSPALL